MFIARSDRACEAPAFDKVEAADIVQHAQAGDDARADHDDPHQALEPFGRGEHVHHEDEHDHDFQIRIRDLVERAAGPYGERRRCEHDGSEHDQRHGFDVDAEARQTVAEPVQNHRADADERADFREMKRLERSQVILGAEEQHGGECEEAGVSPLPRLCFRRGRKRILVLADAAIGGRGQIERQPFVRGAAGHGDGAG
jgi:hypothetical protein